MSLRSRFRSTSLAVGTTSPDSPAALLLVEKALEHSRRATPSARHGHRDANDCRPPKHQHAEDDDGNGEYADRDRGGWKRLA
jgi:hypothetical protein